MKYPSLRKILREALDAVLDEKSDTSIRVRPSTLGSCPRRVVTAIIRGDPEDLEVGEADNWGGLGRGALAAGKIYELAIQPYFTKYGFLYQCFIVVAPEIDLYGHCDFYLPPESDDDEAIIVDIKTTGKSSIPFLPQTHHKNQIQLYMHGALHGEIWEADEAGNPVRKLPNPKKICGALLYIIREDPYLVFNNQEWWISYNEDLALSLIEYAKELRAYALAGRIPDIPKGFAPFAFPCYYSSEFGEVKCPYWNDCWSSRLAADEDANTQIATELIQAYREYRGAKDRYERKKNLFKDIYKDFPRFEINTPQGSVVKYLETREIVNYRGVLQDLVSEGQIPDSVVRALLEKHTKVNTITTVRVKPKGGNEDE